jgi:hypothetical protein
VGVSERGKEPRPDADDERVAGSPASDRTGLAAEQAAEAMGNQAFGRALAAAEAEAAQFGTAPAMPTFVELAARGAMDVVGGVRGAAEGAAEATSAGAHAPAGAAIDKAALASRVGGIARGALDSWTATATIVGVTINGPSGFGGTLLGAPLTVFMQSAAAAPPAEAAVQARALHGFADGFQQWCASFQIPGTPLWPSFAAVPAPEAPPTAAIPMPLIALAPAPLPLALVGADQREQEALDAVAMALRGAFELWRTGRIVHGLLGRGPVPTFAPPFVPVGPVVGGTAFAPPPAL